MLSFSEEGTRRSALRFLSIIAAVLAFLITGVVASETSANTTTYDSEELQFLQLINEYRQSNGAGPLLLSDTLAVSAERHSQDMAKYHFFAHRTASSSYYAVGSAPWDRMAAEGYSYNTYKGENIAVGCEAAEKCFELWRNSPPHNAAMLNGRYQVIGIARVNMSGSGHGWYWTTDFGATVDPTAHPPEENPHPEITAAEPSPKPQEEREKGKNPVEDGAGIENGEMSSGAVWQQESKNGADLIVDGYAYLGDYDDGRDELSQRVVVGENERLSYDIRIETREWHHPSDLLLVRLTDEEGEQLAVLKEYSDADATAEWRHETVDLSRFAGQKVYLSFLVETDPMLRSAFYLDRVALESRARP